MKQDREQFYSPTNGEGKIENIRAWELLCQRAIECKYHQHLDDRTLPGLIHCIQSWLSMEGISFETSGNVITVEEFALEIIGTHKILPTKAKYNGPVEHVPIKSLRGFLVWFDQIFEIDF